MISYKEAQKHRDLFSYEAQPITENRKDAQRQTILRILQTSPADCNTLKMIASQYNARIYELRKDGYEIIHSKGKFHLIEVEETQKMEQTSNNALQPGEKYLTISLFGGQIKLTAFPNKHRRSDKSPHYVSSDGVGVWVNTKRAMPQQQPELAVTELKSGGYHAQPTA